MRSKALLAALAIIAIALSGCTSEDPATASVDATTTDTGDDIGGDTGSGDDTDDGTGGDGSDDDTDDGSDGDGGDETPPENTPPTATLEADNLTADAGANVTFTIDGDDADGDALSWALDADNDGTVDAEGEELPVEYTHVFAEAGTYTATLTVTDGTDETAATVEIVVEAASTSAMEVYFLHGDDSMDHTPAAEQEDGHGSVNLASPITSMTFTSTEPTEAPHAAGSSVEIHIQGFTLHPHPAVDVTASLSVDGMEIGSGTATEASISVGLVTTPCTDWVITFTAPDEIPAGSALEVSASADNVAYFAPCFTGGEEASRVVFS